jgi:hypothetical protein
VSRYLSMAAAVGLVGLAVFGPPITVAVALHLVGITLPVWAAVTLGWLLAMPGTLWFLEYDA